MWNPLALLKPVTDVFTSWNDGRVKLKEKKMAVKMAIEDNKATLAASTETHNHDWEMANLEDRDRWLRRISFGMFSAPFVWALFDPVGVEAYFKTALASMPEWYIQLYAAMVGGVWGFAALKNSLPGIVGGVKKALQK